MSRRDSIPARALRVMFRQGWLSAMAIGDLLDLPSIDVSTDRNALSRALRQLCDRGLVDRRVVERFGSCGSRFEFPRVEAQEARPTP